jgi:hypothetical protein
MRTQVDTKTKSKQSTKSGKKLSRKGLDHLREFLFRNKVAHGVMGISKMLC